MTGDVLKMMKKLLSTCSASPHPQSALEEWLKTGITLEFLGTGSARPTRSRNVSSLLLHHSGGSYMFDCGDGTLRQLLTSPIARLSKLEAIFITHLHCDHYYGLPGVSMALGDTEVVGREMVRRKIIYGPRGLGMRLGSLLGKNVSLSEFGSYRRDTVGAHYDNRLPFQDHLLFSSEDLQIVAIMIEHSVPCFGYIIKEKPTVKIDIKLLQEQFQLPPGPAYGRLQRLEPVTINGVTIDPSQVSTIAPGRTIVILGDTCNPSSIEPYAMDCDVLVHEATGIEHDKASVLQTFHSTGTMAGAFARRIRAKHLILNHFSPRQQIAGVPCDEDTYQRAILKEAKAAAGSDILVTAAYDHLAIPIPRRTTHLKPKPHAN